ncbi:MAG TPA: DNA polymerase/3'-5' exonuclease PolX, partial [Myxococcales bacterium]
MSSLDKTKVVHALRDISLLLQLKGENAYRCRAYEIGADRIAGVAEDLSKLVAEDRLRELPGIGDALAEKIKELIATGRMQFLESLRAEFPPGMLDLLRIPD